MKKALLILLLTNILPTTSPANPVTLEQARLKALTFVKERLATNTSRAASLHPEDCISLATTAATGGQAGYYVFNIGHNDGYVVVSGDDRTPAILGYGDEGSTASGPLPANMQAWLQGYADQLEQPLARLPKLDEHATIAPMLTARWDQGEPYNLLCPKEGDTNTHTGCLATAIAQMLYYHRYPTRTTATIPGYVTGKNGFVIDPIAPMAIDWDHIRPTYSGNESEAERQAVATLMKLCGTAVGMDYSVGGSSSATEYTPHALKTYFGYDEATRMANRGDYGISDWSNLIYSELEQGRPVVYGGQSSGGGHAFVVDGYDREGYFHVNWGWSGQQNGHFLLNILDPGSNSGAGASASTDGYSYWQNAVVGAQPATGRQPDVAMRLTSTSLTVDEPTTSVQNSDGTYSMTMYAGMRNYCGLTAIFDLGVGVFREDGTLKASGLIGYTNEMEYGSGWEALKINCSIPPLPAGNYRIEPLSRTKGSDTWLRNVGSNRYYILAVIKGNTMRLTPPTTRLSATMQAGGTLEVGGLVTATAAVSNTGNTAYNDVLFIQVDGETVGGRYFEADAGVTEPLTMSFRAESEGTKVVSLGYMKDETFVELTHTTVSISRASAQQLTGTATVTNAQGNTVSEPVLTVQADLVNTGSSNYNNEVVAILYKYDEESGYAWTDASLTQNVSLPAGRQTTVSFSFDNLEDRAGYLVYIYYWSEGRGVPMAKTELYIVNAPGGENPSAIGSTASTARTGRNEPWTDLHGRRSMLPARQGIYIKGNRKVVVR